MSPDLDNELTKLHAVSSNPVSRVYCVYESQTRMRSGADDHGDVELRMMSREGTPGRAGVMYSSRTAENIGKWNDSHQD